MVRSGEPRRIPWDVVTGIAAAVILFIAIGAVLLASRDASLIEDLRPEEIAGDPVGLMDESVVTTGYVHEMLTEHAMTVASDANAEPVLVLLTANALVNGSPPVAGALLRVDEPVQLFGTVGSFDRQAMADDLGIILHEDLFGAWEGAPVIIADQVDTAPLASLDPAGEP